MNKPVLALTLLCGFLLGVVAGPWLWPRGLLQEPPAEPAPPPPPPAAALPLSQPPPPEPPPAPEPELMLKGVFLAPGEPERSRALITRGDESPRTYKVDDKLPDGSVLKAVNNKDVEVEKNGETRTLSIIRGKESGAPAAIPEPAAEEPKPPAESSTGGGSEAPAPDAPPAPPGGEAAA